MGTFRHRTVIVQGYTDTVREAQIIARYIYSKADSFRGGHKLVGEVVEHVVNGTASLMIAPDGSKEGWPHSRAFDVARNAFIDWLRAEPRLEFVEVEFGGDVDESAITATSDLVG